jgi:phosphatidylserine decarboxylase
MKKLFVLLQHVVPQHLLSRMLGALAECHWPWLKNPLIRLFIRVYKVDMSEAMKTDAAAFSCFNEFFTRELKPNTRPISTQTNVLVSPVDGSVSEVGRVDSDRIIQAKGHSYTLVNLLGGSVRLSEYFLDGSFITLYLSPKDYHRVHSPLGGKLTESFYLPGSLFSVNETTVNNVPDLFCRNERLVMSFDTTIGKMALIMVGAMIVAGIKTPWHDGVYRPNVRFSDDLSISPGFATGDELGQFQLGSTVILLFEPDTVIWDEGISSQRAVNLGERLASFQDSMHKMS